MLDFHTHILPNIDDGSNSVEQSMQMLNELRNQNINAAVATPHFDIKNSDIETFLRTRDYSFERLSEHLNNDPKCPLIILGAEVRFYSGFFYRIEGLEKLCIGNTKYILVELPFTGLDRDILRGLENMVIARGLIPVIAHIDRYLKYNYSIQDIRALLSLGAKTQINAGFVNNFFTRKKALNLIKKGYVHVLGSDCHDTGNRKTNIGSAYKCIERKLGKEAIYQIEENVRQIITL